MEVVLDQERKALMSSLPVPLVLAAGINNGWHRCGIQDGHAVSIAGKVSLHVPLAVVYRSLKVKKKFQRETITTDSGLSDATTITSLLRKSGYADIKLSEHGMNLEFASWIPPTDPFVFTMSRTKSWDDLGADVLGMSRKSDEAGKDYFPDLHMQCPNCGCGDMVRMPGNRLKWQHHILEPECLRCVGKIRLMLKRERL